MLAITAANPIRNRRRRWAVADPRTNRRSAYGVYLAFRRQGNDSLVDLAQIVQVTGGIKRHVTRSGQNATLDSDNGPGIRESMLGRHGRILAWHACCARESHRYHKE